MTQNYNGVVTSYAYDYGDKLTSDSNGGVYTYDHNGNWTGLTSGGSTYTFQYDAANRLTYYGSPSTASRYSYNGMNLRVAEYDSGSGQHDLINDGAAAGSSLLIDHNLTARTVAHVYTPGIDQRDGLGGALHLMGVDALGTVRAFVNDDGGQAVTDTFGAYAYGIPRTRTGSDAFTFAFAGADGYQTDPNGLLLLGNRVYHPYTGRFLTRDPAGAGSNDYEYCDDNPLKYTDSKGLYPQGVTDHPGGDGGGGGQWYSGDDFDGMYGGTAGTGTIAVPVYYAVFTADRKTGNVEGYQITGLAYYELVSLYGAVQPYLSLLHELNKLNYKKLQSLIRTSNAAGHEYWFFIVLTQKGLKVIDGGQTPEAGGGSIDVPSYALSWGHTHPDHIDGDQLYGVTSQIDSFSDDDKAVSDSHNIPGYLGAGDTYDVFRYLPNGKPLGGTVSDVNP